MTEPVEPAAVPSERSLPPVEWLPGVPTSVPAPAALPSVPEEPRPAVSEDLPMAPTGPSVPFAPQAAPPSAPLPALPPLPGTPEPDEDLYPTAPVEAPPGTSPAATPSGVPEPEDPWSVRPPAPGPPEPSWLPGGPVALPPPPPGVPGVPPSYEPPPSAPTAPEAPPATGPGGEMRYPEAPPVELEAHVRKLLGNPGDPRLPGYPARLLPRADAEVALDAGRRPVAILFYDDGAKASALQAAEFLPVLRRYADRIDMVPIDVKASASWSDAERQLVKTYYMAVVPTTVVLSADRRPLLLQFQRISAATLEATFEGAVGR